MPENKNKFFLVYLEDDINLQEIVKDSWIEALEQKGFKEKEDFELILFNSFEEAKEKLKELHENKKNSIFITDVQIGDKQITAELKNLLEEYPKLHTIIISGFELSKEITSERVSIFLKETKTYESKAVEAFTKIFREHKEQHQIKKIDLEEHILPYYHIAPAEEKKIINELIKHKQVTKEAIQRLAKGEKLSASSSLLKAIQDAARQGNYSKKEIEKLYKNYEAACKAEGKLPIYGKFLYLEQQKPLTKKEIFKRNFKRKL